MDTGSHILIGVSLAGLAQLDPAVAQHPYLSETILAATILGSNAPDFDTVVRLKGYGAYLKTHRGWSHSIPALFLWPVVLTLILVGITGFSDDWFVLFRWILFGVVLHVGLDALNTYGVQCLRPFTKRWVHLDILPIFDPFLFTVHGVGVALWGLFGLSPYVIFPIVYGLTVLYIGVQGWRHYLLVQRVEEELNIKGIVHVFPGFHWFRWLFVGEDEHRFYTGKIEFGRLSVEEVLDREARNPIIDATLSTDGVRTFLAFAQRIHVTCQELADGYEVRWSDVRFWHNRKLPFGVDVKLDRDLNVVSHTLGWRKRAWDPPFV